MNPRTLLIAAAVIAAGATHAEARKALSQTPHSGIDVAALSPYPTENMPGAFGSRRAPPASNARSATRHSRRSVSRDQRGSHGLSVVRSGKTGATAMVGTANAARFQAYVDEIEAGGGIVRFMGGVRGGHCGANAYCRQRHKHFRDVAMAMDVCQLRRGVVDSRCRLPGPRALAAIAARHGLFEGGRWCDGDYGHVEAGASTPCPRRSYAVGRAIIPHSRTLSARRHHHVVSR